jgi:hypothetical protein
MLSNRIQTGAWYWLIGLLLLWGTLLFGGFVIGLVDGSIGIPTPARMGSSLVLVLAGWSWCIAARSSKVSVYGLLIALGMLSGFIGDLFMANLVPIGDKLLGGMASFGIGHIFYITALVYMGRVAGLSSPFARWMALLVWLLIGAIGWYVIVFPKAEPRVLAWAALGYVLLLASTAGIATGLAVQARALWPLAFGTALFFISDLMIALGQFGGARSAWLDAAIWLTYGPAQALIVYSTSSWLGVVHSSSDTDSAVEKVPSMSTAAL